jgi:hypothetical protein
MLSTNSSMHCLLAMMEDISIEVAMWEAQPASSPARSSRLGFKFFKVVRCHTQCGIGIAALPEIPERCATFAIPLFWFVIEAARTHM